MNAKILKALITQRPEIISLNEFRNNESGIKIRTGLLKAGYNFQINSAAKKHINSVLIASRIPCNSKLHSSADENFPDAIVSAEFSAFTLYGVYFPHKKKHKLFNYLFEDELNDKNAILVGDFNTGINYVDQKGNSFWYEDDLKKLLKDQYSDAFRLINDDKKEYSWYSHQGNGYRYDHTFIHNNLIPVVKDCKYIHSWREEGLSDHSPMILNLA